MGIIDLLQNSIPETLKKEGFGGLSEAAKLALTRPKIRFYGPEPLPDKVKESPSLGTSIWSISVSRNMEDEE